jgi:hypothetical protein
MVWTRTYCALQSTVRDSAQALRTVRLSAVAISSLLRRANLRMCVVE